MNKFLLFFLLFCMQSVLGENILMQPHKKKESVSKLKEALANDFDLLMQDSTFCIRELSALIDQIVQGVKQLAGQQDGILATSDRKVLQSYQEKVNELKKVLKTIQGNCCLDIKL